MYPDPCKASEGFEPPGQKMCRPAQDRYGHAEIPNTPEKEKQRKGRFSAQPQARKKRVKHFAQCK